MGATPTTAMGTVAAAAEAIKAGGGGPGKGEAEEVAPKEDAGGGGKEAKGEAIPAEAAGEGEGDGEGEGEGEGGGEVTPAARDYTPYQPFMDLLAENPEEAAIALAERLGYKMTKGGEEPKATKSAHAAPPAPEPVFSAEDREALVAEVGPRAVDIMEKVIEGRVAKVEGRLTEAQNLERIKIAASQAQAAMTEFKTAHPDFKEGGPIEQKMGALMGNFLPGPEVTESEYLESIYHLATREGKVGDAVKAAAERIDKSAKASTKPASTTPSSRVVKKLDHNPTFQEAAEAALRGEILE